MTTPAYYLVIGSTSDHDPIMENVTAATPRHAAAKVHVSSLVPMVNTYQVKTPGNAGEISQQTINDMQAYLQCERFGL